MSNRSGGRDGQDVGVKRLLVVSPHCDDGVFACGGLLEEHPGSIVVTICAGRPATDKLTEWDEAGGFQAGDDVIGIRREEDRAALGLLRAQPVWLDFYDSQYKASPTTENVARALERVLREAHPDAIVFPLGLFHDDHKLAHAAALALRRRLHSFRWYAYEDAIYRRYTGLAQERLYQLYTAGWVMTPVALPASHNSMKKRSAVACYQSQLRALCTAGRPGYSDVFSPETFWRIEPQHESTYRP